MKAQTMTDRWEQLCLDILSDSRNELYLSMRYLDLALSALKPVVQTQIEGSGTDGRILYVHHKKLADLYEADRRLVNRLYLHSVMHCLLRHLFKRPRENGELWRLSCDIAVEFVIDSLYVRPVRVGMSALRRNWYDRLEKAWDRKASADRPVLTPERIYRLLSEMELPPFELTALQAEFDLDDHSLWPSLRDPETPVMPWEIPSSGSSDPADDPGQKDGGQGGGSREDWQEISEKTQTAMETFSREMAGGDGKLLEQVRVENRERYDYKSFLRKFAVLREEMQVDPDSFDYVFYTYGLSVYGNLPLIEPQEQREVYRIADFVIVIDVSMSTRGSLVKTFLEQTYAVLTESETYLKKVRIHILQCDERVRDDRVITSREDLDLYMRDFTLTGGGGTDFRPAFVRVQELLDAGEFSHLKGMIYFTDGLGIYPGRAPAWETAFVFMEEDRPVKRPPVPAWAIRLVIPEEEWEEADADPLRTDYHFLEEEDARELHEDLLW